MQITFDEKPGRIFDFFQAIGYVYNGNIDETLSQYNLTWSKENRRAYDFLVKNTGKKTPELAVFFEKDSSLYYMFYDSEKFWKCQTIESFINSLSEYSNEQLKVMMLKKLMENHRADQPVEESELKAILSDESKLIRSLNRLDKTPDFKWNALQFFEDPERHMGILIDYLKIIAPKYTQVLQKNENSLNQFNQFLSESIKTQGVSFLTEEIQGLPSLESYEEIYMSSAFLCDFSVTLSSSVNGRRMDIYVGKSYREALRHMGGKNEEEHMITALKTISDPTRYQILKLLREKPCYGQEIAEKMNLTMATVSHHMELLCVAAKVVKIDISGRKVYYSLIQDEFKRLIDYLKANFR